MHQLNNICFCLLATLMAWVATSCTEKIDLVLKNAGPQLVIEGRVTDEPGPYYVLVSKSTPYNTKQILEGVDSAIVVISDDAGNTDTLTKIIQGVYLTNTLQGVVGRRYLLEVRTEEKLYQAFSTMPPPVAIDSIGFDRSIGFDNRESLSADCFFRDPAGVANYYKVEANINGEKQPSNEASADRLWDGKFRNLFIPNDTLIAGDTLEVSLLMLDGKVFEYFNALEDVGGGFNQPAAPANPPTNIMPQTLGYFSAHSVSKKIAIVP